MNKKITSTTPNIHIYILCEETVITDMLTLPFPTQKDTIIIVQEQNKKEHAQKLLQLIKTVEKPLIINHSGKIFDTFLKVVKIIDKEQEDCENNCLVFVHLKDYCSALEAVKKVLAAKNLPHWLIYGSITKTRKIKGLRTHVSKEDFEFLYTLNRLFANKVKVSLKELIEYCIEREGLFNYQIQSIYRLISKKIHTFEKIGIIDFSQDSQDRRKKVIIKM